MQTTEAEVYDLVYFLDERVSRYLQFVPLLFVIGWFVVNDRPGRTASPFLAVFFGVGHGVERAVGIIERAKCFLGPPTVMWLATAVWVRWRRVGRDAASELFVRYAVAFCLTLPVSQAAYHIRFDSFAQPSGLGDRRLTQVATGAVVVTLVGTVVIGGVDRWWQGRHALPVA